MLKIVLAGGVDNKHHKTYLKAEEVGTFLEQLADATAPLPPPAPAAMAARTPEAHAATAIATHTAAMTQSQTQGANNAPAIVPKPRSANADEEPAEVAE